MAEVSRVKIKIVTQVLRDGLLLAEGYVILGSVDRDRRIARLDPEFVDICRRFTLEEKE